MRGDGEGRSVFLFSPCKTQLTCFRMSSCAGKVQDVGRQNADVCVCVCVYTYIHTHKGWRMRWMRSLFQIFFEIFPEVFCVFHS
jgi:hypothetical protein